MSPCNGGARSFTDNSDLLLQEGFDEAPRLDVHSSHGPLPSSGEPARRSCYGQGQGVGVEAVPELLREACEEGTSNSHHRVFCSVAIGSVPATSLFSLQEPARDDLRATASCLRARSRRAGCFEPTPPRAVFCRARFRACDAFLLVVDLLIEQVELTTVLKIERWAKLF